MPRVKIDYVVSFSSEDPEHQATNLLAGEVSKKKWLCNKGEPSSSVVLQLAHAVEISAIHIGAYHAALVEVLVGLSEKPSDPYQVLVPSCVFVPPTQSRRDEGVARVRSFTGEELTADTRGKRYDRVRIVCSQPYNKHCQYGLSFVHIHEPEIRTDAPQVPATSAVPSRLFALDTFSSDDDDFRPGELFAKHLKSPSSSVNTGNTSTGGQIRQATSNALRNISDSSTKLLKTPISKAGTSRQKQVDEMPTNRRRDDLMYNDDDARPHDKIDRVVNRHMDEKTKDDDSNKSKMVDKKKDKDKKNYNPSEHSKKHNDNNSKNITTDKNASTVDTNKNKRTDSSSNQRKQVPQSSTRKRKRDDDDKTDDGSKTSDELGKVCGDLSLVLRGVTLALSGYAGPRRAALRDTALLLGARYSPDWSPQCTHLICAFPNTPKLRTARASGAHVGVATAEWVEQCLARRRRLPWRWFATEPAERVPAQPVPDDDDQDEPSNDEAFSEEDTDDEIENALALKTTSKAKTSTRSPAAVSPKPHQADMPDADDVAFVKDERVVGHVTLLDSTDEDDLTDHGEDTSVDERIDISKALPDFFDGYTFVISNNLDENREILARYVRAFGGLVIQASEVEEDSEVNYVICSGERAQSRNRDGSVRVHPSWVWRCARERRLCAVDGHA